MKSLLLGLALAVSLPALAAPPTDAQAQDIERLFGFDAMLNAVVLRLGSKMEDVSMTQTQKACMASSIGASIEQRLLKSLSTAFVNGENIEAWKRFGETAGGRHMMQVLKSSIMAIANDTTAPNLEAELDTFSTAEQRDVVAFMQTPPAALLHKGLGKEMQTSDAEAEVMRQQVMAACGLNKR